MRKKHNPEDYRITWLRSRKRTEQRNDYMCEFPECLKIAVDIMHINSGMGRRRNKADGSDLICVCPEHSIWIKNNSFWKTKQSLLNIIRDILDNIHRNE